MNKKVMLIGGTMGIGKTTVSKILLKKIQNAVFLDGAWCLVLGDESFCS